MVSTYVPLNTSPFVRLDHLLRHDDEPPACNVPTEAGWCMRDEGHAPGHLPLPANYPPQDVTP